MTGVKTFIIAELTWMTNWAFWGRRTKNNAPVFHFGSSESLMTGVLTSRPSQLIKAYGSGAETTQQQTTFHRKCELDKRSFLPEHPYLWKKHH